MKCNHMPKVDDSIKRDLICLEVRFYLTMYVLLQYCSFLCHVQNLHQSIKQAIDYNGLILNYMCKIIVIILLIRKKDMGTMV